MSAGSLYKKSSGEKANLKINLLKESHQYKETSPSQKHKPLQCQVPHYCRALQSREKLWPPPPGEWANQDRPAVVGSSLADSHDPLSQWPVLREVGSHGCFLFPPLRKRKCRLSREQPVRQMSDLLALCAPELTVRKVASIFQKDARAHWWIPTPFLRGLSLQFQAIRISIPNHGTPKSSP